MEQHYRMTLQDAIAKYQAGDITIKGLIHFYILIRCKPGWKIRIDYETLSKELPVKKSTFYHVISCLKKEGAIAWEAVKGILVSRVTSEPDYEVLESQSQILESESQILESKSP